MSDPRKFIVKPGATVTITSDKDGVVLLVQAADAAGNVYHCDDRRMPGINRIIGRSFGPKDPPAFEHHIDGYNATIPQTGIVTMTFTNHTGVDVQAVDPD